MTQPLIVYIWPHVGEAIHDKQGERFLDSYDYYKPKIPHRLYVVMNGRKLGTPIHPRIHARLQQCDPQFIAVDGSDYGWDIGAFIYTAKVCEEMRKHYHPGAMTLVAGVDMMVCMGGHSYLDQHGWLERMVDQYEKWGKQVLCGAMATREHEPHIRTTGFWTHPELLASYPHIVTDKEDRMAFEFGERSITRWAEMLGWPTVMVTKNYSVPKRYWRDRGLVNIYMRGDQSELLLRDRVTDEYDSWPEQRQRWHQQLADGLMCWPETQFSVSPPAKDRVIVRYDHSSLAPSNDGGLPQSMPEPLRRQIHPSSEPVSLDTQHDASTQQAEGSGRTGAGRIGTAQGQAQESAPACEGADLLGGAGSVGSKVTLDLHRE